MCEQAVERTPAVQNISLIASGMPSSGPALPCAMRTSEALAISVACSGVSRTNALSARAFSIAVRCAVANSLAEKDFFFSPSRASTRLSEVNSLTMRLIRTLARANGFLLDWLGRRFANEPGFSGTPILFHQRPVLRFESVDHRQVSKFAGDTHCLNRSCGTPLCAHSTTFGTTK